MGCKTSLLGLLFCLALAVFVFLSADLSSTVYHALGTVYGVDFYQYWTASELFFAKQNPYDQNLLFDLQKQNWIGAGFQEAIVLWYPPMVFLFTGFVSFFDFEVAALVWFVLSLILYCISIILLFKILLSKYQAKRLILIIIAACLPGALMNIYMGQISFILLLAFVLFLLSASNKGLYQTFLGGFLLSITLIKPHLLYLLYLYLLFGSFKHKNFSTLTGLFFGAIVLNLLPALYSPSIISDYLAAASNPPIQWLTPTIGSWLEVLSNTSSFYLRILPSLIVIIFFFVHSRKLQLNKWSEFYLLIPISLISSPYGWSFDQILILPAIAYTLTLLAEQKELFMVTMLFLLINLIGCFLMMKPMHHSIWYPCIVGLIMVIVYQRKKFTFGV